VLSDAGHKNEGDFGLLAAMEIDAFIAVGRESKDATVPKNEQPLTAAMRAKLKTKKGREHYRRRKHIVETCLRMGETSARLPSLQLAGSAQSRGRVEPRLFGTESPSDGDDGSEMVSGKALGSPLKASAAP
jgi:hypothetical protein